MSTGLVNLYGRPLSATVNRYDSPGDNAFRLSRPRLDRDIMRTLDRNKHRILLADSRYIATTMPLVRAAIQQKAEMVAGSRWRPQFAGADREWGERAEAKLRDIDKIANVRGGQFTRAVNWRIASQIWDIDGDFLIVKHRKGDGMPKSQYIEAHRLGTRGQSNVVPEGRWEGRQIVNGIVYDAAGRPVAFNILGSSAENDRLLDAKNVIYCASPDWFSEGRPLPSIAYAILDWYDLKETRNFQKIKSKAAAAISLVESNDSGMRGMNDTAVPVVSNTGSTTTPEVTELMGGLYRYIKNGAGIETLKDNTPSRENAEFDETIQRGAFLGLGWRYEMVKMNGLSSAAIHPISAMINQTVQARFNALEGCAVRELQWQLSVLIERGDLEPTADWWNWTFTPPPVFSGNPSRISKQELDEARAGVKSEAQLIARQGRDIREHYDEIARVQKIKQEVAEKHGVPVESLGRLEHPGQQANANP